MAELVKKLHFLKNGTEQTARIYTTTNEAGSNYLSVKVDGTTGYVPINDISHGNATIGRVLKGGSAYAILSQAKPAYTEKSWTTAGTYTWTAPAGVTRVRVAVCGGGGGGRAGGGQGTWVSGGSGGTSKFGSLIQATGGTGGSAFKYNNDDGTSPDAVKAGVGGSPNGRKGQADTFITLANGGTGFSLSFTLTNGNYGSGGKATEDRNSYENGLAGGGSGGYDSNYVNVTAGTTYSVVVGGGGNGANRSDGHNLKGYAGNTGFVLIAYGGSI